MGLHNNEKKACKEFLNNFTTGPDLTWGFYVYATYTRPQGEEEVDLDQSSSLDRTAGTFLLYSTRSAITSLTNAL
jgi:hypothetical protein